MLIVVTISHLGQELLLPGHAALPGRRVGFPLQIPLIRIPRGLRLDCNPPLFWAVGFPHQFLSEDLVLFLGMQSVALHFRRWRMPGALVQKWAPVPDRHDLKL